ncbi:hypothetical protein MRX96_054321 [Rhipicephalus microplus]
MGHDEAERGASFPYAIIAMATTAPAATATGSSPPYLRPRAAKKKTSRTLFTAIATSFAPSVARESLPPLTRAAAAARQHSRLGPGPLPSSPRAHDPKRSTLPEGGEKQWHGAKELPESLSPQYHPTPFFVFSFFLFCHLKSLC